MLFNSITLLTFNFSQLNLKFSKSRGHVFSFFIYSTLITPYLAQGPVYSKSLINVSLLSITGP